MRKTYLILLTVIISTVAIAYQNDRPQISVQPVIADAGAGSHKNPDKDTTSTSATELPRGKMLYENHCKECHESNVHIRKNRRARSTADIIYWITRWSTHLKLNWNTDDINEVEHYLEETYYKFDAKPGN